MGIVLRNRPTKIIILANERDELQAHGILLVLRKLEYENICTIKTFISNNNLPNFESNQVNHEILLENDIFIVALTEHSLEDLFIQSLIVSILSKEYFFRDQAIKKIIPILLQNCSWANSVYQKIEILPISRIPLNNGKFNNKMQSEIREYVKDQSISYAQNFIHLIELERKNKTGKLNLNHCDLTAVPAELASMTWITELNLSNNKIRSITSLGKLKNTTSLNLSNNQLEDLTGIGNMMELVELNISNNHISSTYELGRFSKLKQLRMSNNKISSIGSIIELRQLQSLYLDDNKFIKIPNLSKLSSLIILSLNSNKIKQIIDLGNLPKSLSNLYLWNNPIDNIPITLFGPDSEFNCLENLQNFFVEEADIPINEVKLILTGNSDVGKSKFKTFFTKKAYERNRDSTHGLEIENYKPNENTIKEFNFLNDVRIQIFDFGGQEYFHNTHQLFFNHNAVYLLLWETATNKNEPFTTTIKQNQTSLVNRVLEHFDAEYWLSNIRYFAKDSVILPIQNKIDIEHNLNKPTISLPHELLLKYQCNKQFAISIQETAADNKEYTFDFEKLSYAIHKNLHTFLSKASEGRVLNEIRKELENLSKLNFISYQDFFSKVSKIKKKFPADQIDTRTDSFILDYFKQQGKILYSNIDNLKENILFTNPQWVSEQMYLILDEQVLQRNGFFDDMHLNQLCDRFPHLNKNILTSLIELMKEFNIIFTNKHGQYIAPQYLPEVPTTHFSQVKELLNDKLILTIEIDGFLPKYVIHNLIARYAKNDDTANFYKYGIKFQDEDGIWLIEFNYATKRIYIYSNTCHSAPHRTVFADILNELKITIDSGSAQLSGEDKKPNPSEPMANGIKLYNILNKTLNIRSSGSPNGAITRTVSSNELIGITTGKSNQQWIEITNPKNPSKTEWVFGSFTHYKDEKLDATKPQINISIDRQTFVSWNELWNQYRDQQNEKNKEYIISKEGQYSLKSFYKTYYLPYKEVLEIKPDNEIKPKRLFISYSSKNTEFMRRFEIHLKPLKRSGLVIDWHDRKIEPGTKWDEDIKNNLSNSDIIVFLLSPDFINTDYIFESELPQAIEQFERGKSDLFFIELQACSWDKTTIANYQQTVSEKSDNKGIVQIENPMNDVKWKEIIDLLEKKIKRPKYIPLKDL